MPVRNSHKKHIVIAVSSLGFGGAEKFASHLAKHIDKSRYRVSVLIEMDGPLSSVLPGDVAVFRLEFPKKIPQLFSGSFLTSRALKRLNPDIVLSSLINMNFFCLLGRVISNDRYKVILVDHTPLSFIRFHARSSRIFQKLIPIVYPLADHVVAVSEGCLDDLRRIAPKCASRSSKIYNPGWDREFASGLDRRSDRLGQIFDRNRPKLLSIGRFVTEKDHNTLLQSLRVLKKEFGITGDLKIVGDGDRSRILSLTDKLGLSDQVEVLPPVADPRFLYHEADVFVLSSRFEGLSLVLIEALALGCPIVSTNCPYGPSEVLQSGSCGLLVPVGSPHALAAGIYEALVGDEERIRRVLNGLGRAEEFRAEIRTRDYEKLFEALLDGNRGFGS